MILLPDEDVPPKHVEAAGSSHAEVPAEPPPSYSSLAPSTTVSSRSTETNAVVPIPNVRPTNYFSLCRMNNSIRGTYVIDPSLYIPSSLLPPLGAGETEATRCNLRLASKNGCVDVHIFVISDDSAPRQSPKRNARRVTIDVSSSNGSVTARLHAPNTNFRPSLRLKAYSSNGSVYLRIPRSFRGPIIATTYHGSISFSEGVSADLTAFSEMNKTSRCFVGDLSRWTEGVEWEGDEVVVESKNGSIKLQYDDEVAEDLESFLKTKFSMIGRMLKF